MAKKARIVTLVRKGSTEGGVYRLWGEGLKNYRVAYISKDGTESTIFMMDRARYTLIEGEHRELLALLDKRGREYQQAMRDHDDAKRHAQREFERGWDKDNPPPEWPDCNRIVLDYMMKRGTAALATAGRD